MIDRRNEEMTALSIKIKEEPKNDGEQSQTEVGEPATLDYNAIYGNMYREFLAGTNSENEDSANATAAKSTELNKVAIPPECYTEYFDIQDVVNEFKVTLEKFGVSQRFAAKYIMEDTSQGNLSFLMDKGKRLRWADLSPKGRIPYVKMKQWLDSKEKQLSTIEIVKESKAMTRQNSNRDAFQRRERFSLFQLTVLCRLFEENSNPSMTTRAAIAEKLNIPPERINVWFQNQRARGFPAKRILQQSFNAASSTNGAARSASIMNSVAMEIVNQSKTDSFLANNTALVNQFVENSLFKNDAEDNDVHKMLLQYSALSDQINSDSVGNGKEDTNLPPSSFDATSNGSNTTEKSADKSLLNIKIKTERTDSCPLTEMNKEMTSNEKVSGYLNHLSQSGNTQAYGSQLDSVVKRITQPQTGAAKRKPAFLNKVITQPKSNAATYEKYPSAYSSPVSAPTSVPYESSPLSALYRQTASVNFTPPNPSFNYLFDIGSVNLPGHDRDFYIRRPMLNNGSQCEPKKRTHTETLGSWGLDLKRRKLSGHVNDSAETPSCNALRKSASTSSYDHSLEDKDCNKPENFSTKSDTSQKVLFEENEPERHSLDTNKLENGSGISKNQKDSILQCSQLEIGANVKRLNPEEYKCNEAVDSTKRNGDLIELVSLNDDNRSYKDNVRENKPTVAEVKETRLSSENVDIITKDSQENNDISCGQQPKFHEADTENKTDKCNDQTENKKGNWADLNDKLPDTQSEATISESKDPGDNAPLNLESKHEHEANKITVPKSEVKSQGDDMDKPLSKEEMDLFKSLYARFVKYHFAQMQFPEIK